MWLCCCNVLALKRKVPLQDWNPPPPEQQGGAVFLSHQCSHQLSLTEFEISGHIQNHPAHISLSFYQFSIILAPFERPHSWLSTDIKIIQIGEVMLNRWPKHCSHHQALKFCYLAAIQVSLKVTKRFPRFGNETRHGQAPLMLHPELERFYFVLHTQES